MLTPVKDGEKAGGDGGEQEKGGGGPAGRGFNCPLVLANRPLSDRGRLRGGVPIPGKKTCGFGLGGEDLEGGACSHNLYTFGPRPRRISETPISQMNFPATQKCRS